MARHRVIGVVTLGLLAAAAPARAQFQPVVMRLGAWPSAAVAGARWLGTGEPDLLILRAAGAGEGRLYPHHDLLGGIPSPYVAPPSLHAGAIGGFEGDPAATVPDVAWNPLAGLVGTRDLAVTWGESPGSFDSFPGLFAAIPDGMAAIRLLPRPQPVLLVTAGKNGGNAVGSLTAADLAGSRGPPAVAPVTTAPWTVPAYWSASDGDAYDQIYPLRLSPAARAGAIEDAIVPFMRGFLLLWHDSVPAGTSLPSLDARAVAFGAMTSVPFLPGDIAATFDWGSCLGAAAMDVDGGGVPDLVFSYSDVYWDTYLPPVTGSLLMIPGGDVDVMATLPWVSLMGEPGLSAITDTGTLRQIELDSGEPAFAVQDRVRERIVIVRGSRATGFATTEVPTTGGYVRELATLDVVGSPAKDLVALVELAPFFTTVEAWVYPDVGDAAPRLAWSPQPPLATPLGVDLTLSVAVSDPDSPTPTVTWIRPPAANVLDVTSLTIDGGSICDPAAPVEVTVRAMDSLGVYVTVDGSIAVEERPTLRIVGADPPGRIVLPPGGATGSAAGEAWPRCGGGPTFTWDTVGLTGLLLGVPGGTGSSTSIDFTIPEAIYPDLLDGDAALTLRAVDGTRTPAWDGTATLPLTPEASGLVDVDVAFDELALAPGELGLARVRLASRIGVPLPAVRAVVTLEGLSFAGEIGVVGAPATAGAAEGEVVVDPLPAVGAVVEIVVPVRAAGGPGAASVELFSSGGIRVSPAAAPSAAAGSIPGCGCGGGAVQGLPIVLALLALLLRARRRANC